MKKNYLMLLSMVCCTLSAFAQETAKPQPQATDILNNLTQEEYQAVEKYFAQKEKIKQKSIDWARFYRYETQNDTMPKPAKVVFLGNSITDLWYKKHPEFFIENGFTGRGIGGQTSSQMLVRFQADVIDLQPKLVLILAGTNDIAQNNGIISQRHIMQNIQSMCELAKVHKIQPILCSLLPAYQFRWNKDLKPAKQIMEMNEKIKEYAKQNKIPYIDYHSTLVDERGGLSEAYAEDGVHPTLECYAIMEQIALQTIQKQLKK